MLVVKLKLVDGNVQIFSTENFVVTPVKDMMPEILDVKVYSEGKVIQHTKRKHQWYYKKYVYKPTPKEEQPIVEEQPVQEPVAEPKPATPKKKGRPKKTAK